MLIGTNVYGVLENSLYVPKSSCIPTWNLVFVGLYILASLYQLLCIVVFQCS